MKIHGNDFYGYTEQHIDDIIEAGKRIFENNAADGEETMRTIIATSGTAKSGRSGRVDTGKMIDSVNHRVDDETQYTIEVSFGWDETDFSGERTPNYALIQEGGFVHVPDASYIPGMHAMQDAATEFVTDTENQMRNLFNK